jgi:hypothetical protein
MKMSADEIRRILDCDSLTDDEAYEILGAISRLVKSIIDPK